LHLPRTSFPIKHHAAKETSYSHRTGDALYAWQAKQTQRPLFILHDGPPYANGDLHIGHAVNKTLKDIINRYKLLSGYRIQYAQLLLICTAH
jgi:isoleucyl-tRNA synthetase